MPHDAASPADSELTRRFGFAERIAEEAGQLTLSYFQTRVEVQRKSDNSPVTIADRSAELLLRELIASEFPDDPILGEEFPDKPGDSPFRWILDPIDGTKSFICGVPLYATLVAVEHDQRGVIGVIRLPALGESVSAAEGHGAWHTKTDGIRAAARVGAFESLSEGLFTTSERGGFDQRGAGEAFATLEEAALTFRTWGDAYGYALVATGRAALMMDAKMHIWDAAAIQPILSEAGGTFTDWQGQSTIHAGEGIGTTPELLAEVLAVTRPFSRPFSR